MVSGNNALAEIILIQAHSHTMPFGFRFYGQDATDSGGPRWIMQSAGGHFMWGGTVFGAPNIADKAPANQYPQHRRPAGRTAVKA